MIIRYLESRLVTVDRNCVGSIRLELHSIGTGLRNSIYNAQRSLEITIMVTGYFRDNKRPIIFSDQRFHSLAPF
jgi:hypothetical protein